MNLETAREKLIFFGMALGFLAILAVCAAWIVQSLGDANQMSLGHWFDRHSPAIWGFIVGFVPSSLTYVFGKRVATKQTLQAAHDAATASADGNDAAAQIRTLASARGLSLS